MDPRAAYEVPSLTLEWGDVLTLYTDGVTEAMDTAHRLFSIERLLECVGREPPRSTRSLAERPTELVRAFAAGAPPSDDITLVVLRFLGP